MQRIRADRRLATTGTALLSALLTCQDLEINYSTIYKIVRYELKSKLKTPRPTHEKQAVGVVEAFQKFLPQRIEGIVRDIRAKRFDNKEIAYWLLARSFAPFGDAGSLVRMKLELVLEPNQVNE